MSAVAAFDWGGTWIRGALVEDGAILASERARSPSAPVDQIARVASLVGGLATRAATPIGAVGIGIAGIVREGRVLSGSNLGLKGFDLKGALERELSLPVRVVNDTQAVALAELSVSGPGETAAFLSVGTGIGGAVVYDGRLFTGGGAAGDFGHMPVVLDGPLCACGARGCLEQLASGRVLNTEAAGLAASGRSPLLAEIARSGRLLHAGDLEEAASKGDGAAAEALEASAAALVTGLRCVAAAYDPHRIVVGGGLLRPGSYLLAKLEAGWAEERPAWTTAELTLASKGDDAGLLGAALLWGTGGEMSGPGAGAPLFVGASRILLNGRVVPLDDGGGVLVAGGRIAALVGVPGLPAPRPGAVPVHDYPGGTLLPGLVDAHVHTCLAHGEDVTSARDPDSLEESVERGRVAAQAMLAAGITAARDLGCRATSAQRLRDGLSPTEGVFLEVAGRPITVPGGHFAAFGLNVSGPQQCRAAVDELVDEGSDLIKVMLTGGTLTPGTSLGEAQFDLEELRAIVDRAHQLGRRVAAHAHGTAGIEIAVAAGVDTVEHCSWLDRAGRPGPVEIGLVEMMAEQGQVVVIAAPMPSGLVDTDADRARGAGAAQPERVASLRRAWRLAAGLRRAGVTVALGSDSFFGQFSDHRDLLYRAEAMVSLGAWEPLEVLDLITRGGAAALGRTRECGHLARETLADLVVVDGNPGTDIEALRRVRAVYRAGSLVAGKAEIAVAPGED